MQRENVLVHPLGSGTLWYIVQLIPNNWKNFIPINLIPDFWKNFIFNVSWWDLTIILWFSKSWKKNMWGSKSSTFSFRTSINSSLSLLTGMYRNMDKIHEPIKFLTYGWHLHLLSISVADCSKKFINGYHIKITIVFFFTWFLLLIISNIQKISSQLMNIFFHDILDVKLICICKLKCG